MQLKISYTQYICPVCHEPIKTIKEDCEVLCTCGLVLETSYKYVAGVKINTLLTEKIKDDKK